MAVLHIKLPISVELTGETADVTCAFKQRLYDLKKKKDEN